MINKKLKICIISEYAYSYFKGDGEESGGAELQMFLLGKELSKLGYYIDFIVFDDTDFYQQDIDPNLNLYVPYDNKNKGISHFYPKNFYKFFSLLDNINADIYVQRTLSPLTGIISLFAILRNKKFVYSCSSDLNVSDNLCISSIQDLKNIFFILGIRYSNHIICQTSDQKDLANNLIKKCTVIKNISLDREKPNFKAKRKSILWVGRIVKGKNPEKYLKLAQKLPEYEFKMIGGPIKGNYEYYKKIKNLANEINNLEFLGFIPHSKINNYYAKSSLFISTSNNEGFPNTFLESWLHGVPVISLNINPDNIISKCKLGVCAKNLKEICENIKILMEKNDLREKMGQNCREYVLKNHSADKIIEDYIKLFNTIIMDK